MPIQKFRYAVMPDLIRHPEAPEKTGFRPFDKLTVLSLSKDSEAGMTG